MSHDQRPSAARTLFEAQVQGLDGATATALRARRQTALNQLPSARAPHWLPVGTVFAAVLTLAVWLPQDTPETTSTSTTVESVAAAATVPDNAELAAWAEDDVLAEFNEDAEFYRWLAEAPIAPAPNTPPGDLL